MTTTTTNSHKHKVQCIKTLEGRLINGIPLHGSVEAAQKYLVLFAIQSKRKTPLSCINYGISGSTDKKILVYDGDNELWCEVEEITVEFPE